MRRYLPLTAVFLLLLLLLLWRCSPGPTPPEATAVPPTRTATAVTTPETYPTAQASVTAVPTATAVPPTDTPQPTATETAVPTIAPTGTAVGTAVPTQIAFPPELPETYTVQRGDHLWGIAERFYGQGGRWLCLYRANEGSIRDANLIFAGQRLYGVRPCGGERERR
ncbi:MAG: LysM peptidoglycan-binding domain-containing protein [Anaerolineae bacterium]|nr:LysM peptidoglycan-binding domain-containing protein [Anaerolineae bacterium]